jgi:hypothetical protein
MFDASFKVTVRVNRDLEDVATFGGGAPDG